MFLRFFNETLIFANFPVYFQCIQISEGALTSRRHSDVIWGSMALILVSMDRGGPHLYSGSKYRGHQAFYIENPGRGCNNPPSEDVYGKPDV